MRSGSEFFFSAGLALAARASAQAGVVPNTACSALEVIEARGTSEPRNPNFGVIVGDPLFNATQQVLPTVTGYSVNYPASFDCGSEDAGVADTLSRLATQSAACPEQKYVLAGYSQGADVMHFASLKIDPALYSRIVAMVMFGDPGNKGPTAENQLAGTPTPAFPPELANKVIENCAAGDPVCTNDGQDANMHLSYNNPGTTFMTDSANYIMRQFATNGMAGAQPSPNGGPLLPGQMATNQGALAQLGGLLGQGATRNCPATGSVPAGAPAPAVSPAPAASAAPAASVAAPPPAAASAPITKGNKEARAFKA